MNFFDPFGLSADSMHFDGTHLIWYNDKGEEVARWKATSGRRGMTAADQEKTNMGPIPEGSYTVDPNDTFHVGSFWDAAKLAIATGFADYGTDRAPLTRTSGSAGAHRSAFWLHGGRRPGSAGCIDVGENASAVFSMIRSHEGKIPIGVTYPTPGTMTAPPLRGGAFISGYPMGSSTP